MIAFSEYNRNLLRQLALAHCREALRDRRGMVTMLLVFGGLVIGLVALDLLVAENTGIRPPGTALGAGVLAGSLPLIALFGFSSLALVSTAVPLTTYRANGVLRQFSATPVSRTQFIVAHLPVRFALGLAQIALLLVLAGLFANHSPATLLRASVLLISGLLLLLSFGYLIGAIFQDPDRTMSFSFMLTFVLVATSGTVLPFAILPEAVGSILSFLPTTLFAQGLRAEFLGVSAPMPFWATAIVILGVATALFALSSRIFRWEPSGE